MKVHKYSVSSTVKRINGDHHRIYDDARYAKITPHQVDAYWRFMAAMYTLFDVDAAVVGGTCRQRMRYRNVS